MASFRPHVLRLEAIVHNSYELHCGRVLEKFPEITSRLAAMLDRFATALDCVDIGFIADDQILDQLPQSSQLGKSRVGGIDLNKPRMRHALRALQALVVAPKGFTAAQFTVKVHSLTGLTEADTPPARLPTTSASSAPKP